MAKLLVRRGIFDDLAKEALGRAVHRRNRIEHQYEAISLPDAEDAVHSIRATVERCVAKSDPYSAPGLFGFFMGGFEGGPEGERHFFNGWSGLLFLLAHCDSPPWFGIVIPSSNTEARVRRAELSSFTAEQLLNILAELDMKSDSGYSTYGESVFRGQLAHLGLTPP